MLRPGLFEERDGDVCRQHHGERRLACRGSHLVVDARVRDFAAMEHLARLATGAVEVSDKATPERAQTVCGTAFFELSLDRMMPKTTAGKSQAKATAPNPTPTPMYE